MVDHKDTRWKWGLVEFVNTWNVLGGLFYCQYIFHRTSLGSTTDFHTLKFRYPTMTMRLLLSFTTLVCIAAGGVYCDSRSSRLGERVGDRIRLPGPTIGPIEPRPPIEPIEPRPPIGPIEPIRPWPLCEYISNNHFLILQDECVNVRMCDAVC